jgi:Fe-S-cluster-containing hydrogenase component 2
MNNNGLKITRDETRCVGCNECIIVCPQSGEGKADPVLVPPEIAGQMPDVHCIENCIQCMTCWDFCRAGAITFEGHHAVKRLIERPEILLKVAKII